MVVDRVRELRVVADVGAPGLVIELEVGEDLAARKDVAQVQGFAPGRVHADQVGHEAALAQYLRLARHGLAAQHGGLDMAQVGVDAGLVGSRAGL